MPVFDRICLRSDPVRCFACGKKTIHIRIKIPSYLECGWECEECKSIRMDQPKDLVRKRPDGWPAPGWD